ncbi:aldose epimerase family protein [Paenibacillus abyssi]|uniref:Aldose epimerase n=1 Tax=Paenibacillus abyssi TaxID=1340531 RepID=A0A917FVI2_9BACL|nr:aldose epimerase [Paenibacillus abyssi]GGG06749.1 hypothetical protein GCM10010916_24580 [Paenibacillus abyssi]
MANYKVNISQETYTMYELVDEKSGSFVRICPERGGIATELTLNGQPLFYLDESTFLDPSANIRGGNPILFPICGQLTDMQYEWDGHTYTMKNHGVARVMPWEVVSTRADNDAALTIRLRNDAATLQAYPFEFELLFTYILQDGELRLEQHYSNLSDRPMPMYAGFHPYFRTDNKAITYETDATTYFDYNDNLEKKIQGPIDLNGLVESVALLDASKPEIKFDLSGGCRVKMAYSEHFTYVVLWSVEGKPFVCVEPWMAKTNELNRKEELPVVPAGEAVDAWLSISCEKTGSV